MENVTFKIFENLPLLRDDFLHQRLCIILLVVLECEFKWSGNFCHQLLTG